MISLLSIEHGYVFLGGEQLPGILKSRSVRGQIRFDEAEQDGLSGKVKDPIGWEDAACEVTLELLTDSGDSCFDKLERLNAFFQRQDSEGEPVVYRVADPHLAARGVTQVTFSGLASSDTDQDDVVLAICAFMEHNPPVLPAETRSVGGIFGASGAASTTAAVEPGLEIDLS